MKAKLALIAVVSITLSGCAISNFDPVEHYLSKRNLSLPTATSFQSCRGYGCRITDQLELSDKEWKAIDKPFKRKSKTAEDEREKITQSIAKFEQIVGAYTGTSEDVWGTFQKGGHKQQDCVDESTNTSMYMLVLEQRGHIKFHTIGTPQSRVGFFRWPHQTATITDIQTHEIFAVDSWFYNNGEPPRIIAFRKWKDGWSPRKLDRDRAAAHKQKADDEG